AGRAIRAHDLCRENWLALDRDGRWLALRDFAFGAGGADPIQIAAAPYVGEAHHEHREEDQDVDEGQLCQTVAGFADRSISLGRVRGRNAKFTEHAFGARRQCRFRAARSRRLYHREIWVPQMRCLAEYVGPWKEKCDFNVEDDEQERDDVKPNVE